MQLVDDDVVAGFEVEGTGEKVLAFAGRVQKTDFCGIGADQLRELRAHGVGFPQHLVERYRAGGLAVRECASGLRHRTGHRRNVGRVEVNAVVRCREVSTDL